MKTLLIIAIALHGSSHQPHLSLKTEVLDNQRQCRARMWEVGTAYGIAKHVENGDMLVKTDQATIRLRCQGAD